jgi:serine/threonine protein kinase
MDRLSTESRLLLASEADAMEVADHPNVIKLFQVIDTVRIIYLVMEYAGAGTLEDIITNHGGKLPESSAQTAFAQVAAGVAHLHGRNVVHRDLKPGNIFVNSRGEAKIGDFGFAAVLNSPTDVLSSYCGSPHFAAPELFAGKGCVGQPFVCARVSVLLAL